MQSSHFKFAAVSLAVVTALMITLALGRTKPPPVVAAAAPEEPLFIELWREAAIPAAIAGAAYGARAVPTEKVTPVPVPVPVAAVSPAPPKAKVNVCIRHGMRKVKHGRYGWRCKN